MAFWTIFLVGTIAAPPTIGLSAASAAPAISSEPNAASESLRLVRISRFLRFDFDIPVLRMRRRYGGGCAADAGGDSFFGARGGARSKRHRPAPPPGHPTAVSSDWPGGGAGRCSMRREPQIK